MFKVNGARASRLIGRAMALLFEVSPQIFAALCVGAGALLLTSGVTPAYEDRLDHIRAVLPPILIELSHFGASISGFLLLLLSAGLWRRRRGAWLAAIVVLLVAAFFSLLKGLDWEEAAQVLLLAALLAPCRAAFDRRSRVFETLSPSWLMLVLTVVAGMLWLGFFAYRDVAYSDDLWWSLLIDREVSGFLRVGAVLALLAVIVAGRSLISAPGARSHGPADDADIQRALTVLHAGEGVMPDGWLAMLRDKALMFSPSGRTFLAYRVIGRRWITMGEPVGPQEERLPLLWAFAELADSYGGVPVFYAVEESALADLATLGLAVRKIGEEALVDTHAFTLQGKSRQNLRTAVNRCEREGANFEMLPPGGAADVMDQLKAVSDVWLTHHIGVEKGFSLGRFDPAYLTLTPVAVVRQEGRIIAFANLMPGGDRLAVDLMRFTPDAPPGVMDYLFIRAIEWAKEAEYRWLDLGRAPLAGLENRRLAPVFARVGALVFEEGGALYGFAGLRAWKAKFAPDWRPCFIAAPTSTPLALALLDVALLTSGGWTGMLGLNARRASPAARPSEAPAIADAA
ncbi:bifunctional lysylphosphatidylglycerol flippase/synthetase MprF [Brevundimonas sp. M20]|nr:bifunctional lysylphosphatidylglycerol flippase/synthetase MprF [Brevundimonas sp. M20]